MGLESYAAIAKQSKLSNKQFMRALLLGSYSDFLEIFFNLRNPSKAFTMPKPVGRECHVKTVAKALTDVFNLKSLRLIINMPPGHFKSTMLVYWVAWCMARYPDCNFIYVSHSYSLAEKFTAEIKDIMSLPEYAALFDVHVAQDSRAKGAFKTTAGGSVKAFGSSGDVVGQDAGFPNCDRFSGAVLIDDAHKPDDVFSDVMRQHVIDNFRQTISQRPRGVNVPILFVGQRLHEDDLAAFLLSGGDGRKWERIVLRGIDDSGEPLMPEVFTKDFYRAEQEHNPYVFWSQHQQEPTPPGGGIFLPDWFLQTAQDPDCYATFITADTAETDKTYNDATVFSFWGLYKMQFANIETGQIGLHWIDCREMRVEPKDLESQFYDFYAKCMKYKVKPSLVAIEKKSTGVTLVSSLKSLPGVRVLPVDHGSASGSKISRLMSIQSIVASHLVSICQHAEHKDMCLTHMKKITANGTHRHDDIADTLEMAIKLGLIDKIVIPSALTQNEDAQKAARLYSGLKSQLRMRG